MKNNLFKKATKILLVPTLVLGALSACGYNDNNGTRTNTYNGTRAYTTDRYDVNNYNGVRPYATNNYNGVRPYTTDNYNGVRPYTTDYNNGTRTNAVNQRVAKRVANVVEDVPGVSRATAIVYGNDIVVGIDGNNRKDTRALERKVHRVVTTAEPGYNVHVTSDNNLHTRIRSAYTTMNNNNTNTVTPGRPVRDLGTDVTNIIRDIGRTVTAPFR